MNPLPRPGLSRPPLPPVPRLILHLLSAACAGAMLATAGEATLRTAMMEFRIDPATGRCAFADRRQPVTWQATLPDGGFGEVDLEVEGQPIRATLGPCEVRQERPLLRMTFTPVLARPSVRVEVTITPAIADARTFEFGVATPPGVSLRTLRPLRGVFEVSDADGGAVVVPVRQGLLIPADSGKAFQHTFNTYAYEGCHMAMLGVLKQGTVAVLHWSDPYVAAEVSSVLADRPSTAGRQWLDSRLVLQGSARRFRVTFPGAGDHVTAGLAYRDIARDAGWWVPWEQKLAENPGRARLFGASNYKLWSVLDRRMNEDSSREESVRVNWTFDEAARVATHLKEDLRLEKVLFLMGGWIRRGYDNQHPDILPSAPECGGDAAFAEASKRIRALGYVLGLHDNYQDIYRDSPSWNEGLIMKQRDGSLTVGGHWAGGRAYLTCSRMAVDLARRPQNLPAVRSLTGADAYFIDTTYAAGLMECFDPGHPLTRMDDLYWKQVISDDARRLFGIFGSECGREWAIPHSDFFEGLTGVSGRHYHDANLESKVGGVGVPLFEIVYRDCIAMYGKYGYDQRQAAGYVLDHLLAGRPLHYHDVPPHLYWTRASAAEEDLTPLIGEFEAAGPRRFVVSYRWTVRRVPSKDWRVFVHYTTPDGRIVFQDDHTPATPATQWNVGTMEFGTFGHEFPAGLSATFDIRMGLFDPVTGERAQLPPPGDGERRHVVGRVTFAGDRARFEPATAPLPDLAPGPAVFLRGDGGWTSGLHPYDRFVKNTHEVLSPLNELTARLPMTSHRFLSPDRTVQQTVFGSGPEAVTVTANAGQTVVSVESAAGGRVELPRFGFLVESPQFIAFHAGAWGGRAYPGAALFTLRSLDHRPILRSGQVRVFHGWGDPQIRIADQEFHVPRESVLSLRGAR